MDGIISPSKLALSIVYDLVILLGCYCRLHCF